MKSPATLRVELRRSPLAIAWVCAACIATASLIAWLPGNEWLRAGAVLAVGARGVASLRSWAMRVSARSIAIIEIGADRRIVLTERCGRRLDGVVQPDTYVGAFLTTLVMRPQNARWSRAEAILADMMPAHDLRRLRTLLRFGELPEDAARS